MTIANLVRALERRGHRCSLWIDDPGGRCAGGAEGAARDLRDVVRAVQRRRRLRAATGSRGADVVVATGWQTVARVRTLPGARRAPTSCRTTSRSSSATSVQRAWADDSYRHGLYPITARPVAGRH